MWSVLLHYSNKLDTTKPLYCLSVYLSAPPWHFSLPLNFIRCDLLGIHEGSYCLCLWALWKPCGFVPLDHVPISHDGISLKAEDLFKLLTMELHQRWVDLHPQFLSFCSTCHPQKVPSFQGRTLFSGGSYRRSHRNKTEISDSCQKTSNLHEKCAAEVSRIHPEGGGTTYSTWHVQPVVNNMYLRSFLFRGPLPKALLQVVESALLCHISGSSSFKHWVSNLAS